MYTQCSRHAIISLRFQPGLKSVEIGRNNYGEERVIKLRGLQTLLLPPRGNEFSFTVTAFSSTRERNVSAEKYYLMIYGIQAVQGACNATLIEMLKFTNAGFSFVEK